MKEEGETLYERLPVTEVGAGRRHGRGAEGDRPLLHVLLSYLSPKLFLQSCVVTRVL